MRAFEIGNTFMADIADEANLPEESYGLSIGLYGKNESFYTLKGMVEELLAVLGIPDINFEKEEGYGVFHPGRCARIKSGDIELGIMGEIHPEVADTYDIDTRAYVCEMFLSSMIDMADREVVYKHLPKYPSTARDIALVVDETVEIGSIEKIIRENGADILVGVELFDIYRGKQVEDGKKSAAFTLTYRSDKGTLRDEDVAKVHDNILVNLRDKLSAVLREI